MSTRKNIMPEREPVLTPTGFIKRGKVREGTVLRTPDGQTAKAVGVHAQTLQTYRMEFTDGSYVVCTADEPWLSRTMGKNPVLKVRTTQQIQEVMARGKSITVQQGGQVEFDREYELTIKPYTLGALLGDGCLRKETIRLIKRDMELFGSVRQDGYTLTRYQANDSRTPVFGLRQFSKEKAWLSEKGLLCRSHKKYVPTEYKHASLKDRMELIQGLMDTDGYVGQSGHCTYTSTSRRLARDVQWLIRSIGGIAKIRSYIPYCTFKDGTRKKCRRAYVVDIRIADTAQLFNIPRKKDRCLAKKVVSDGFHPAKKVAAVVDNGICEYTTFLVDGCEGAYIGRDFTLRRCPGGMTENNLK